MKDLFHGTTYDIAEIDVAQGKGYKVRDEESGNVESWMRE